MLDIIVRFLAAYSVTHYALSTVVETDKRVIIIAISAIVGVLFILL